mmetsp:Transcript_77126/g.136092  ORF Transcript_77126/g.136092 Transcript_77126/m.136092 type:complete len:108 (-) Transcript_77126:123-446(-)|eukprot:CAMPEP_0197666440 /NCGR_PEP_ID=MMETSP1338-20131121/62513_1 /TAXON_ID=43686 ORGANISM="Pelagodinium beii, Strain RCC1491" /NCGR_SAMPLE_ID=MMETSP1338 /ASSEMBLY_ACC=CAM_ASM_000754 /LENGTH=107 /DNA_ID=CAMNT_0043245465 /DNA_START=11 /DNA_END=334 /DNA_ORIENTATION=+
MGNDMGGMAECMQRDNGESEYDPRISRSSNRFQAHGRAGKVASDWCRSVGIFEQDPLQAAPTRVRTEVWRPVQGGQSPAVPVSAAQGWRPMDASSSYMERRSISMGK